MVTLNLPTTQDLFSYVERHLLTQNEQALNSHGNCRYRTECDGKVLKCAVGCLIIDKHYLEDIEDKLMDHSLVRTSVNVSIGRSLSDDEVRLLRDLQSTHDGYVPGVWLDRLDELARRYGLVSKALNWTPTQIA